MSTEVLEELQRMKQEKTCWNCLFSDSSDCCIYGCVAYAIFNGVKLAKDCEHFINKYNSTKNICDYCDECKNNEITNAYI